MKTRDELNNLSGIILDASIRVHKEMGPGLLESVYQVCLKKELEKRGVTVQSLVQVPLSYAGDILNKEYVIDMLVDNEIIIELKSVDAIHPIHEAQLIIYLKLADKRLGFIINFNVVLLKHGFRRFVNKL